MTRSSLGGEGKHLGLDPRVLFSEHPDVLELCQSYGEQLRASGYEAETSEYAYNRLPAARRRHPDAPTLPISIASTCRVRRPTTTDAVHRGRRCSGRRLAEQSVGAVRRPDSAKPVPRSNLAAAGRPEVGVSPPPRQGLGQLHGMAAGAEGSHRGRHTAGDVAVGPPDHRASMGGARRAPIGDHRGRLPPGRVGHGRGSTISVDRGGSHRDRARFGCGDPDLQPPGPPTRPARWSLRPGYGHRGCER